MKCIIAIIRESGAGAGAGTAAGEKGLPNEECAETLQDCGGAGTGAATIIGVPGASAATGAVAAGASAPGVMSIEPRFRSSASFATARAGDLESRSETSERLRNSDLPAFAPRLVFGNSRAMYARNSFVDICIGIHASERVHTATNLVRISFIL